MRRALFVSFLVGVLAPVAQRAAVAQPQAPARVIVAEIDGSIDRTLAGYLLDTLAEGERTGATVVLQLDTAGTLDQDAVGLARRIFESKVPVIAWVGPAPAKAQGAGLLFMYASSLAAVSPGAGVGPLQPLDLVDARSRPDEATLEDLVLGWAAERGKPAVVDVPSFPLPAQDALDRHIAQVVAPSIPDLLEEVDRSTVETAAGPVTLRTRIAESRSETPVDVRFTAPGPVDRVLHAAASPAAIYVLLVLGFAALAFELVQPGFGFAGLAGLSMLALGTYGLTAVPASWLGLLLLVGGVLFLTADVLLRRLGALTALGLAAFVAGSVLAFHGVAPAIRVSPWLVGSLTVGSFLYYGFALTVALQSRERITSTQRGLVGLVGETRGELRPEGPVYAKGTLWRGRSSDGPIPAGTRVRIRGVDGLILRVEPEPGPEGGPPARD
ncbi:MAG: NfeD family protein [Actinomycetota bacterium]